MRALAATALGCVEIDLETEEAVLADEPPPLPQEVEISLPLVLAAGQVGSRIVAVVDRRPPLVVSDDAGLTWREAGGGLPAGTAIALDPDDPDLLLFASESRLFLSDDGGRFWHGLAPELIGITAVAFS
jgi:phage tail protein X